MLFLALAFAACATEGPLSDNSPTPAPPTQGVRTGSTVAADAFLPMYPTSAFSGAPLAADGLVLAGGPALEVDDDGVQCPGAFPTIQAAVDAAAASAGKDKIKICAGTYVENVLIGAGNSLDIEGTGTTSVTVQPVPGTAGPAFDVFHSGEVDFKKLTVDGMSLMAGGPAYGIQYRGTDGTLKELVVRNIRNASGSVQGVGIGIRDDGGTSNVKVEKTLVENWTRVGIFANGVGTVIEAKDNTVIGPVAPKVWAPNGIQVSRGATGKVEKNTVSDATSPNPPGGAGSGILLFCSGPTEAKNNGVTTSDVGIVVSDGAGSTVKNNDVSSSVFDGISLQYIGTLFGPGGLGCPMYPSPTRDNTVENNKVTGSAFDGISLQNFDTSDPAPPLMNTFKNNTLTSNAEFGVGLYDGTENMFDNNKITGSGMDGIWVDADGAMNVFDKNDMKGSGVFSCEDTSVGGGTAGTANTWTKNKGEAPDSPDGICP